MTYSQYRYLSRFKNAFCVTVPKLITGFYYKASAELFCLCICLKAASGAPTLLNSSNAQRSTPHRSRWSFRRKWKRARKTSYLLPPHPCTKIRTIVRAL